MKWTEEKLIFLLRQKLGLLIKISIPGISEEEKEAKVEQIINIVDKTMEEMKKEKQNWVIG